MSGPLTAVSLFAGIGGFDTALERCGVQVSAAVEIDADCRRVLASHFPRTVLFDDVTEVTGDQLLAAGFVPERGIITAGWPCQGNSVAGRRGGMADPRSGLWRHVVRLVAETRPRWFVGENVPGILSIGEGRDFRAVIGDLDDLGYGVAWRVLDAQWFGVPQRRRRVFIAAGFGDPAGPVQVLLEPESGARHSAARGATRPDVAGTLGSRVGGARTTDLDGQAGKQHGIAITAPTLTAGMGTNHGSPGNGGKDEMALAVTAATLQGGGRRGHRVDAEGAAGGHLIAFDAAQITSAENRANPQPGDPQPPLAATGQPMVAYGLNTSQQCQDGTVETLVTHALTAEGADASEDGTGRGTPLVPYLAGRERCAPPRRGPHEQRPFEPDEIVPLLSCESPLRKAALQGLREACEGSRILLQALSALETMGRPADSQDQPAQEGPASRGLNGGAGVSIAVRRLTPL